MSELHSTSNHTIELATQTDSSHEPAHDKAAGRNQDNATIEADLDEAELPTRADSRAGTWGPDANDEDSEPDLGPKPDNATIEASLDEVDLPTRAESRAATWGPDATDEDEEPDYGPDSDHTAIEADLDEAELPTRAESRAATWGPDAKDEDQAQLAAEHESDLSTVAARPDRSGQQDSAGAGPNADQNPDASSSESIGVHGEHPPEERSGTGPLTGKPDELGTADRHGATHATDALTVQAAADGHDQDVAENWPSHEDRARLHDLYQEYLKDVATAQDVGRETGTNVVGNKPDRSPADISDLPPTGEELVEMEGDKKSRFQGLWHEAEKEDALDGIHTELETDANTLHEWLTTRPPEGHAEQPVPVSPGIGPQVADHAIDAGNAATACLALGFVMVELGRRIHERLNHRKENANAGE
jgi:hypothetical protein